MFFGFHKIPNDAPSGPARVPYGAHTGPVRGPLRGPLEKYDENEQGHVFKNIKLDNTFFFFTNFHFHCIFPTGPVRDPYGTRTGLVRAPSGPRESPDCAKLTSKGIVLFASL